jgi:hypothetical protein
VVIEVPAVVNDDSIDVKGNATTRIDPYVNDVAVDPYSGDYDDSDPRHRLTARRRHLRLRAAATGAASTRSATP